MLRRAEAMRSARLALVLGIAVTCLLAVGGMKVADRFSRRSADSAGGSSLDITPQQSSGGPEAMLSAMIQAGNLPDLRLPDFSKFRGDLINFYGPWGNGLAWVKEGRATSQAQAAIGALQDADAKGLDAEDYDGPRWAPRIQMLQRSDPPPSAADLAGFDLALTVAMMRYVSDVHLGRVNPRDLHSGFNIGPAKYDLAQFLRQRVVDAQDVSAVLATTEPPFQGYRLELEALATYRRLAREDSGEQLPVPAARVRRGGEYQGVQRLTELLRLLGDLPPDAVVPTDETVYSGALEEAVKRFQSRHGLDTDGRLGRATLEQLNTPLQRRVRQLQLSLERWRWVPHEFSHPPIVVNIPEFELRAWDEADRVGLSMKVIVGEAFRHETPVFAKDMKYLVFWPYWNVPLSIQRRELVPKIIEDRDYLAKNGYEVTDNRGAVVSTGTVSDEVLESLRRGPGLVRQRPGPLNSLGPVVFMFPNEFDVYLHGTPAKELFSRSRRDFSHGCIRVEYPEKLAVWALHEEPGWDERRVLSAMKGSVTIQVNLGHPIPVLVFYTTAVVTGDGTVKFLQDIYGHDAAMERVLAKGYPYAGQ
jgi:murein L,D-transpeptidase YcbB/YkuD